MNLPIQQLLQKIQFLDDQIAFKQLYQALFFKLYQFAYAFVKSKENAEEVVNDVFLGVWQKRKTLDTINNINVYLYVSVKNASLNYLRKSNRNIPLSLDELATHHLRITANPESVMITRELESSIRKAIEQLPHKCKIIFKMIKYDGLSYKEAAAILGISVKTVDTQLYIALKKLAYAINPVLTGNNKLSKQFTINRRLPGE